MQDQDPIEAVHALKAALGQLAHASWSDLRTDLLETLRPGLPGEIERAARSTRGALGCLSVGAASEAWPSAVARAWDLVFESVNRLYGPGTAEALPRPESGLKLFFGPGHYDALRELQQATKPVAAYLGGLGHEDLARKLDFLACWRPPMGELELAWFNEIGGGEWNVLHQRSVAIACALKLAGELDENSFGNEADADHQFEVICRHWPLLDIDSGLLSSGEIDDMIRVLFCEEAQQRTCDAWTQLMEFLTRHLDLDAHDVSDIRESAEQLIEATGDDRRVIETSLSFTEKDLTDDRSNTKVKPLRVRIRWRDGQIGGRRGCSC